MQIVTGVGELRGALAVTDEAAHPGAALGERGREPAADEAGGPRDERAHQAVVISPCR